MMILTNGHPEGSPDETSVRLVSAYIYNSLCRGEDSLQGRLYKRFGKEVVDPYLGLYALQQHGKIRGQPVASQVYIHAKLMIVDDRVTLIGSSNINDRSLVGDRDSELTIRMCDTEVCDAEVGRGGSGTFGGAFGEAAAKIPVGRNIRAFRVRLMNQHLGADRSDPRMADPLSMAARKLWTSTAKVNSAEMYKHFPQVR